MNDEDTKDSRYHPQEKRPLVRAWIWIWYNDVTRFVMLSGTPAILGALVGYLLLGPGEHLRHIAMGAYLLVFCWMIADNDYSNLRRIGMNEYRRPLVREEA